MKLTITVTTENDLSEGDRYALEDKIIDALKELGIKVANVNVWGIK